MESNETNQENDETTTTTVKNKKRSEMLCMIGIPASLTCNELLDFVVPYSETLIYLRIIRDAYPNRYMAILKFRTQV